LYTDRVTHKPMIFRFYLEGRWLLLLLLLLLSSSSPLCRVFILIFLWQTMSVGNTVLLLCVMLILLVSVLNLLYFYI